MRIRISDNSKGRRASRAMARIALLSSLIAVALILMLIWTRQSGNATFERDRARIVIALKDELHRFELRADSALRARFYGGKPQPDPVPASEQAGDGARLSHFLIEPAKVNGDEAGNEAGKENSRQMRLLDRPGFRQARDFMVFRDLLREQVASIAGNLSAGIRTTFATRDNRARHTGPSIQLRSTAARTGIAIHDDTAWIYTLVPAQATLEDGKQLKLVAATLAPATGRFLARIADEAGVGLVNLSGKPASGSGIDTFVLVQNSWRAGAGRPGAGQHNAGQVHVNWKAGRSGDRLAGWMSPWLLSFTALLIGLIGFYSTRRIADSERYSAKLATLDPLSGLPNRLLFGEYLDAEIARSKKEGSHFALLYVDLDRFKEINDSFGHDIGDCLIIGVSQRVSRVLRSGDVLSRFGGDEFAVLQTNVQTAQDCAYLAQRILKVLNEPFELEGHKLFVGASVGIAVAPHDSLDRNELMRLADLALYRAKSDGRNRFVFFEESMGDELYKKRQLETELRLALDSNALNLQYQPIVDTQTHKVVGAEALLRWNHPVLGMIGPSEFVPVAEERGLIIELGEWVLRRACLDAAAWPGIKVGVNVSPVQFRHRGFVQSVKDILKETGFDPCRLEIELTESVIVADAEQAEEAMIELRSEGIRLALDDFGTGYSSLIYLRRFALDKIKIDKSFFETMEMSGEGDEIVRSVVELGSRLGLTVTAEGVECVEHLEMLAAIGCDEIQGHLFGGARPPRQIPALLGQELVPRKAATVAA